MQVVSLCIPHHSISVACSATHPLHVTTSHVQRHTATKFKPQPRMSMHAAAASKFQPGVPCCHDMLPDGFRPVRTICCAAATYDGSTVIGTMPHRPNPRPRLSPRSCMHTTNKALYYHDINTPSFLVPALASSLQQMAMAILHAQHTHRHRLTPVRLSCVAPALACAHEICCQLPFQLLPTAAAGVHDTAHHMSSCTSPSCDAVEQQLSECFVLP